jgi:hypothetical protein
MFYFAYGSNLNWAQMWGRCPSASFMEVASLPNHRLAFTRYSSSRGVRNSRHSRGRRQQRLGCRLRNHRPSRCPATGPIRRRSEGLHKKPDQCVFCVALLKRHLVSIRISQSRIRICRFQTPNTKLVSSKAPNLAITVRIYRGARTYGDGVDGRTQHSNHLSVYGTMHQIHL